MIEEVSIVDTEDSAAVVPEPIVVKKRGRPKGAPNKPKVVPNPPKAPKKQPAAPPSESEEEPVPVKAKKRLKAPPPSSSDEEPVPKKPRRSRQRTISPPPVMDTRQVASEVLQLLSNRQVNQATARREKYRSWFPAN